MRERLEMKTSANEYKAFVRRTLAESKRDGGQKMVFGNRGVEHARTVVDAIVGDSRETLDIFCSKMSTDVFTPSKIRDVLSKHQGLKIRVLLEDDKVEISNNEALSCLKGFVKEGRVSVKKLKTDMMPPHLAPSAHVTIGDGMNVRLELNRESRQANVFLQDAQIADQATDMFDSYWLLATRISA